jgi:energy-coupling factor transporter transmembrane protein EcfT
MEKIVWRLGTMLSILIYIIVFSILVGITYLYYKEIKKPLRDQIEVGIVLGLLFLVGLLTAINIYTYKPPLQKIRKDAGGDPFESVERIIVDKVPDDRTQLTIVSAVADSSYTVIISKEDAKRLMAALKE